MQLPKSRYLGLLLFGCFLAALGWCLQTYVDLVRLEASVVDTRARVETASRIRLELVENLLRGARTAGAAPALAQVDQAAARVREVGLLPSALGVESGQTVFREAQGDLSDALNAVWSDQERVRRDPSVGRVMTDLKPEIQLWSAALERHLGELEQQLQSFRALAARFPGSMIASIPRREGPAAEPVDGETTRAEHPASGGKLIR